MEPRPLRVLVTGGASGIGLAAAELFAEGGASVAILDRESAGDVADRIPEGAVYVRADVTDDAAVVDAVGTAIARLGGLDVVVNNAGIGAQGALEANDDDEWFRVLDVNVVGHRAGDARGAARAAPVGSRCDRQHRLGRGDGWASRSAPSTQPARAPCKP